MVLQLGAGIGSIVPGAGTAWCCYWWIDWWYWLVDSVVLIGGADKLTGADKVIGKDEESQKAEKELQKKSKINPLELTLDKFDQVVDRFSKVIMSLDLSGGQLPDKSDLDASTYSESSTDQKKLLMKKLQAQQTAVAEI